MVMNNNILRLTRVPYLLSKKNCIEKVRPLK
jgi:hypothetical protein